MSECLKHKLRKRKDCPDCFPPVNAEIKAREIPKDLGVIKISKKKDDVSREQRRIEDNLDVDIKHFVYKTPEIPEVTLKEVKPESDRVRDFIDKIIHERLINAKKELYELGKTEYEHLVVPSGTFNVELMMKLEKDGWGFCQIITNVKEHQYGNFDGSAAIFKRVKHAGSKTAPVFKGK